MTHFSIRNILVPCNKRLYDIDGALNELHEIHYRQFINVEPGALAYIYAGKPFEQGLIYVCKVVATNETHNLVDDKKYFLRPNELKNSPGKYMRLKLITELNSAVFDYYTLREHGLKSCMQGQCFVPNELQVFINSIINL